MRYFIIIPNGHPVLCDELASALNWMLRDRNISGNAGWYYDELVDEGTEYGVKLSVNGLSPSRTEQLIAEIAEYCEQRCGDTVVIERG